MIPASAVHYHQRVANLEAELTEAKDRIRELERALGSKRTVPERFGLTRQQACVLGVLLTLPTASRDSLVTALYDSSYRERKDLPDHHVVSVVICHIRKKLKPFGIAIESIWGEGWRMSPENKQRVADILAMEVHDAL